MNVERFHLILVLAGRPTMHGWWGDETTARRQFATWVGDWGRPGARIALVDEETGELLTTWPEESQSSAMLAP